VRGEGLAGTRLPGFSATIDRNRLLTFCAAIGEVRPVYRDVTAARAAGHPDLPVPPTFLCALEFGRPQPYLALERLGAPLSVVLHAEQGFDYLSACYAGDRLDFEPVIDDYTESSTGRLGFLRRSTTVCRADAVIAHLTNVLAIRWDAPELAEQAVR
jgi:hypothetical protein